MKVVSYLKTVPAKNNNKQKTDLLFKFVKGVDKVGDVGKINNTEQLEDSEVAVIQGWVHNDVSSAHLKLRNNIIHTQVSTGKHVVCADANLFLYNDKINPYGYLRYSFNGIFPNTGIYCDQDVDPARWQQISRDTRIKLEDTKTHGSHILLMLQRNGGWSMSGTDVQQWALETINKIRYNSDRPIVIRAHPGDKNATNYLHPKFTKIKNFKNVTISAFDKPLEQDLDNAWCVVNHNSSAVVGPIIKGYNCFLTDPHKSQCKEVSNHDFKYIESPITFDRQRWLERISMFHWKFSELEDGSCWRHMRNYCQ
jgi:hypothetical protein